MKSGFNSESRKIAEAFFSRIVPNSNRRLIKKANIFYIIKEVKLLHCTAPIREIKFSGNGTETLSVLLLRHLDAVKAAVFYDD